MLTESAGQICKSKPFTSVNGKKRRMVLADTIFSAKFSLLKVGDAEMHISLFSIEITERRIWRIPLRRTP